MLSSISLFRTALVHHWRIALPEKRLLCAISQLANASDRMATAIRQIRCLIGRTLGGQVLVILLPMDAPEGGLAIATEIDRFLRQAPGLPYHSAHGVELRAGGRALGKLIAVFALTSAHGMELKRIATFCGEQLGMVLERICLAETREQLRSQIAEMKNHLATRTTIQRAEGFMEAHWGIDIAAARLWILRHAEDTGLPVVEVALKVLEQSGAGGKKVSQSRRSREREFFRQYEAGSVRPSIGY
jgi:hypothetical protein